MKQITSALFLFFMLFKQSNAQCSFTVIQNPAVPNQGIQVGTIDTFGSWLFIADSCGATTLSFTTAKYGTSKDSNHSDVFLYKNMDTTALFPVTFMAGATTLVNYTMTIPSGDTVALTLKGKTDSTALLDSTLRFDLGITLIDSNNIPQILPVIFGQTMTTSGCILRISKNPAVINQTITPGPHRLIGSFYADVQGGCTFTTSYAMSNNTGSCMNNVMKNFVIEKAGVPVGSPIAVFANNNATVFTNALSGMTLYNQYADIDTTAADSTTIIMDFNLAATSPTAGYFIIQDSIGQTITIDNPPGPIVGPCSMTVTPLLPSNPTLPVGTDTCFGAIIVKANNCDIKVNSIWFGVYGTALVSDATQTVLRKNKVQPITWPIGTMYYYQTVPMSETILANTADTFYVDAHLATNALLGRTFQLHFAVDASEVLTGNPQTDSALLTAKLTVAGPTRIADVDGKVISFYPNPATDYVAITGYDGTFRITDLTGREMIKGETVSEKTTIDVSNLPPGMYFVQLEKLKPIEFIKR